MGVHRRYAPDNISIALDHRGAAYVNTIAEILLDIKYPALSATVGAALIIRRIWRHFSGSSVEVFLCFEGPWTSHG